MNRSQIRQERFNRLNHSIQSLQRTWNDFRYNRSKQDKPFIHQDLKQKNNIIQIRLNPQTQKEKRQKIRIILTPKKKQQPIQRYQKKFEQVPKLKSHIFNSQKKSIGEKPMHQQKGNFPQRFQRSCNKQYLQIQDIIRSGIDIY